MDRSSLLQLIQEQLDPENTGFIGVETFASLVHSHELPLDPAKLEMLVALAQSNDEGQICYQELVDLISSKRSSSFKRAIANGQRALPRDGLLDETSLGFYKRFVRYVAYEILPCEMDRRWYFYQHRTCPPPVFMAIITLTQIIVFLCYGARLNKWVLQTYHPEYMKSPLIYHPGHRARAWRFVTYMFMHVGLEQLGFNALLQLMIGVPLEMVHGILRISFLYLAGVLAELGRHALPIQTPPDGLGTGMHEFRGGPGRVASLLSTFAFFWAPAQFHGPPSRSHRGHQHGPDHPPELRGEPAGSVRLVGGAALLCHLPGLRHLLEHLRLRPAGRPDPASPLATGLAPVLSATPISEVPKKKRKEKIPSGHHRRAKRGWSAGLPACHAQAQEPRKHAVSPK
uniref:rhomboid protease n=1 Tax=Salvator merianae TaxID=96440 RepID=A0A8D0C6G1_SALMN